MKFHELGLLPRICQVLEKSEIVSPTPIQEKAIPIALQGRDLLSSARTGSGKTLAFALPVIHRLSESNGSAALILVPTREIAAQVHEVIQPFLNALNMSPAALVIGGVAIGPQIRALKNRPSIIVATPGRLNDHLVAAEGKFRLDHIQSLVLDEADRMLDMGFLPQVRRILKHLPEERQTLLFSATMPSELAKVCREILDDPERVAVDAPNTANADIEQKMALVSQDGKQDALLDLIRGSNESLLVFARTKRRTDRVATFLEKSGVSAERIHGDRSQAQRQKAIERFRSGKVKVLVATDIAARGLDIPLVELVINYDLPEAREDYVHRIGRTGRAGARGSAISFVAPDEQKLWCALSKKSFSKESAKNSSGADHGHEKNLMPEPNTGRKKSFRSSFESGRRKPGRPEFSPTSTNSREREAERSSRFRKWGQAPREKASGKPGKFIFTGREGESRFDNSSPSRKSRDQKKSFSRQEKRFGGHGWSSPPMERGSPRGRWARKPNREQPRGSQD